MEELIKEITAKAGITSDQAKIAITTVAESLKSKMPHYFHAQIDNLLNGGTLSDGVKNKMEDLKGDLEDAAKNFGQKIGEMFKK